MSSQRRALEPEGQRIDLDAQTAYVCRHCREDCINHEETPEAQHQQCVSCWRLPSLEDTP